MRWTLLALVVLTAGCAFPRAIDPGAREVPVLDPTCAAVDLVISNATLVLGDGSIGVNATVHNCGAMPLPMSGSAYCGHTLRLAFRNATAEFRYQEDGAPPRASYPDGTVFAGPACLAEPPTVPPGGRSSIAFTWDGHVTSVACETDATANGTSQACAERDELASLGSWDIEAAYDAADNDTRHSWSATRTVQVIAGKSTGLVQTWPVDLDRVAAVSRARAGDAPTPNATSVCDCGFVALQALNLAHCDPEHPVCPLPASPPLRLRAPFYGTVTGIFPPTTQRGSYLVLRADVDANVTFWAIGAQATDGLAIGDHVYAGQDLGAEVDAFGLERDANGTRDVLPFPAELSAAARADLAAHGVDAADLTLPRASTTPARLACDPTFVPVGPSSQDDWVALTQPTT